MNMGNTDQLWTVVIVLSIISCVKINTVFANSDGDEINNVEPSTTSIPSEIAKNNEDSVINLNATDQHKLLQLNEALSHRVMALENRLEAMEVLLTSLKMDTQFHHPTSEVQFVDMEVVHWDEAVKNGLRNVAIPFQAGFELGALSSWEFSLSNENDAITVNLLLIEERYGKRAIFAGFTAYILDSNGNVYSQANALPVNFLDGSGRNLHLPNIITLNEVSNSSNRLISDDDVFKLRFRLELLGVGHKLYSDTHFHPRPPARDVQTVIFDVSNLFEKLEQRRLGNETSVNTKPLAYTKFMLTHDTWSIDTNWSSELFYDDKTKSLSCHVILEQCDWPKLFASFYLEVWDLQNKALIHKQAIPVNNFVKDRITIDPLLSVSQLEEQYQDEMPAILQFKLHFVVYGTNARYYSDVF